MKTALVCIAKNEDYYIQEWMDYHFKIGFDHIFIYENNWKCSIEDKRITKIQIPGQVKQVLSYNHFIRSYGHQYDWAAFFDVDEFLVLKKHNNVKDFILDYRDYSSIAINWVLFGDNHLDKVINNNYSLIKRFTKRQIGINKHVKVIINPQTPNIKMEIHNSNYPAVSTTGEIFGGPFYPKGNDEVAQINHYFCKTREEFAHKVQRGRADVHHIRQLSEFDSNNTNHIEDVHAYNFMYGNPRRPLAV